jgi:DNA-binding transcriptional regulator/RsmH inhibitor MraZ
MEQKPTSADTPLRIQIEDGRMRIPPAWRELLHGAERVYITNRLITHLLQKQRVLVLFTLDERDRFETNLKAKDIPEARLLVTFYFTNFAEDPIGPRGRIPIPNQLQKFPHTTTVLLCRPDQPG